MSAGSGGQAMLAPEPSPSWIASSARWRREGPALRRAQDEADAVFASALPTVIAAVRASGAAGISPVLLAADTTSFTTSFIEGARPAKLDDLQDAGLLREALGLRTRFRALDVPLPERGLFEDVERLREAHRGAGVPIPEEADELGRALERFAARRERFAMPPVPCHGDGAVSNLLLVPGSPGTRLTGWSLVARRDPLEEAGSVVGELAPWCVEVPAALAALDLPADAGLVAQAWSVADDLRWGLIASWRMAVRAGEGIDYIKYGLWRFTRGRAALSASPQLSAWAKDPR